MWVAEATYAFRIDNRTDEQMADNISANTEQEAKDANQLKGFFIDHGYQFELIDNGIDNSGKLIKFEVDKSDTNPDRKFSAPDFKFRMGYQKDELVDELVEVKTSWAKNCATIKAHCMDGLLESKNKTWTLMVFNNEVPEKFFVLLGPETLKKVFEAVGPNGERDALFLKDFPAFGYKDSWRFFKSKVIRTLRKCNYVVKEYNKAIFWLPLETVFTKHLKQGS